MQCREWSQCSI